MISTPWTICGCVEAWACDRTPHITKTGKPELHAIFIVYVNCIELVIKLDAHQSYTITCSISWPKSSEPEQATPMIITVK